MNRSQRHAIAVFGGTREERETVQKAAADNVKRVVLFDAEENICDEMYRNGISKIILLSGHGGNRFFLPLYAIA